MIERNLPTFLGVTFLASEFPTGPEMSGELVAAFTGNHGWFWRNRTDAPVTVTLRTGGEYLEIKVP